LNAYHEELEKVNTADLSNYLFHSNSYAAIEVKPQCKENYLSRVYEILKSIRKSRGLSALARLGFSIGGEIETPYFPISFPKRYGISVALRYADLFQSPSSIEEALKKGIKAFRKIEEDVSKAAKEIGLPYLGIDASLSPWMNESIIPALRLISGAEFPSTGSAYAVWALNRFISKMIKSSGIRSIGFNEIMMPVGEDNLLKKLVAKGKLRLTHLTYLAAFCLVGVDMVLVDNSSALVKNIVKDLIAAYNIKKRPIGMRVFISSRSHIYFPMFGQIPKAGL